MFGVGKYKTRDGDDAEVVAVVNGVAIGFTKGDATNTEAWNAKTGGFHFDDFGESRFDLIDPNAKKPIKLELWLTIYHDIETGFLAGGIYDSLGDAKRAIDPDCVAITKVIIDCMEGDNLA